MSKKKVVYNQKFITDLEKTPGFQPGDESSSDMSFSFRGNHGLKSVEDVIKNLHLVIKIFLVVLIFGFLAPISFRVFDGHHYTILAKSFLQGRLDLVEMDAYGDLDLVEFEGKYFWHLGPFPAIILIPFVLISDYFGFFFYQGYILPLITFGVFFLTYKIAVKFGYKTNDAIFLGLGFCFASIYSYIAINPQSWYFSQAVAVLLAFLSLYEFFHKKRWLLIGIYSSLIFATRFTAGLIVGFYLLEILFGQKEAITKKLYTLTKLLFPIFLVGLILLLYNKLRFNDPFDNGYWSNLVYPEFQHLLRERYGLFSLQNILTNFYWYFLASFMPITEADTYHLVAPYIRVSPIGLSFFITSPIFINIFRRTWIATQQNFLWLISLVILFTLLTYYPSGFHQFGPRYMLDLLPLWFILLLYSFKKRVLSVGVKVLIVTSGIANVLMILYFL